MFYIASTIYTKSLVKISVVIKIDTISLYRENKISTLECTKNPILINKDIKTRDFKSFLNSLYQTHHTNPKSRIAVFLIGENCLLLSFFPPSEIQYFCCYFSVLLFFSFLSLSLSVE